MPMFARPSDQPNTERRYNAGHLERYQNTQHMGILSYNIEASEEQKRETTISYIMQRDTICSYKAYFISSHHISLRALFSLAGEIRSLRPLFPAPHAVLVLAASRWLRRLQRWNGARCAFGTRAPTRVDEARPRHAIGLVSSTRDGIKQIFFHSLSAHIAKLAKDLLYAIKTANCADSSICRQ